MGWVGNDTEKSPCYNPFLGPGHTALDHVAPSRIQPGLKTFQRWGSYNSSGQPGPVEDVASHPQHRRVSSIKKFRYSYTEVFSRPDNMLIISLHLAQIFRANCALEVH